MPSVFFHYYELFEVLSSYHVPSHSAARYEADFLDVWVGWERGFALDRLKVDHFEPWVFLWRYEACIVT